MNELVSSSAPPSSTANDPVAAFERMSHRIAGLTAAVEGFAARQQELHDRDYGPDLAKIHKRQDDAKHAILTLADRPGVKLTPSEIAEQIEAAGAPVRARDHQAWGEAYRALLQATRSLDAAVTAVQTAFFEVSKRPKVRHLGSPHRSEGACGAQTPQHNQLVAAKAHPV